MLVLKVWLLLSTVIPVMDHGQYVGVSDEVRDWVNGLKDAKGYGCCATADGIPPDEVDWDIRSNHYWVRVNGTWLEVSDDAVIKGENKLGRAVVWVIKDENGNPHVRCFLRGTMG